MAPFWPGFPVSLPKKGPRYILMTLTIEKPAQTEEFVRVIGNRRNNPRVFIKMRVQDTGIRGASSLLPTSYPSPQ